MKDYLPLRDYQKADLAFYIAQKKCLNLSDPSTGKTPSVCVEEFRRWTQDQARTAWVMPLSIMDKNRKELLRFTPFEPDDVAIVDGTPKKVRRTLQGGAKVFLMGFDRLADVHELLPSDVKGVDVDELHKGYGGAESARTAEWWRCMRRMNYFIGMTGTLINGRMDTAYPAIHVIEPRYYPSYQAFMAYHDWTDDFGKHLAWKNPEKLRQIFARHAIRRTFEQVYGKEAKVIHTETVAMSGRQRELYDEFKEQGLLELETAFLDGSLPGVNYIRSRQIMEHPFEFPDPANEGQFINIIGNQKTGKEQRLDLHLADHQRTGKPLVIFSVYKPQQRRIVQMVERYGMSVALMNGDTPTPMRGRIDEAFQKGEIQVLVLSPEVADVGFNWQYWGDQEVEHVIFVCLNPMDTSFLQAYRRFIRGVRKTFLLITVLEYENSMDQRVMEIIEEKSEMANSVDPTREIFRLAA